MHTKGKTIRVGEFKGMCLRLIEELGPEGILIIHSSVGYKRPVEVESKFKTA
jgi:hypothetical protein